jgi:hypothetical protein
MLGTSAAAAALVSEASNSTASVLVAALLTRIAQQLSRRPSSSRERSSASITHGTRNYVSIVHDVWRDRTHGRHKAARNQTVVEASLLHSTVLARDPGARFIWFVAAKDMDEIRSWSLKALTLLQIDAAELQAWAEVIRAPRTTHHSGTSLGFLKLLVPLFGLQEPTMVLDTDTVALHGFMRLWEDLEGVRRDEPWRLAHGVEHRHINGGLLRWAGTLDTRTWLRCVLAGVASLNESTSRIRLRQRDPRNAKYGEQAVLIHLCPPGPRETWFNASRRGPFWERETGCRLRCHGFSSDLYSTGCSEDWNQKPTAAYHYNCQPRATLQRAHKLLAARVA